MQGSPFKGPWKGDLCISRCFFVRAGGAVGQNQSGNIPLPFKGRTVQITRRWKCKLQLMVRRKPRPYRAAERRQIVATAEGRGRVSFEKSATEWRKSPKEYFAPTVLMTHLYRKPRPSAVATLCRRSAARIGGASRDILHLTWTVLPVSGGELPPSGSTHNRTRGAAICVPT